jgi:hypothetical protein
LGRKLVGTRGSDGPEPCKGLPIKVASLGIVGLFLQGVLHAQASFRDRGLVLLRQVELAMLLKTRASAVLAKGLELGPAKCLVSCCLRRCDGMGLGRRVGCWS